MSDNRVAVLPGVPWVESPFFGETLAQSHLDTETHRIAVDLNRDGFATFDFPDAEIDDRAARIKNSLHDQFDWNGWRLRGEAQRVQDAWREDADVRAIAVNDRVLSILRSLYGRRPIPFQTLNFPIGTQQHVHSDSLHFSTIPERFMCGVWVALEDIDENNGPLIYYPGSHKWPIYSNEHVGHRITEELSFSQAIFEPLWRALIATHNLPVKRFLAIKGQALIWAANLLHGGDRQHSIERTRWSQVTHYYFEDCAYYTPMASLPALGTMSFRQISDITTGQTVENTLMGRRIERREIERLAFKPPVDLRKFDAGAYLAANPDVAAAGLDPLLHFKEHGFKEGRPFQLRRHALWPWRRR